MHVYWSGANVVTVCLYCFDCATRLLTCSRGCLPTSPVSKILRSPFFYRGQKDFFCQEVFCQLETDSSSKTVFLSEGDGGDATPFVLVCVVAMRDLHGGGRCVPNGVLFVRRRIRCLLPRVIKSALHCRTGESPPPALTRKKSDLDRQQEIARAAKPTRKVCHHFHF